MPVNNKNGKYHNIILVEFEFIVDLDLALFRLIRKKYAYSRYVDKHIISMNNEFKIIEKLINRPDENPLKLIMPKIDSDKLYQQFLNEDEEELLSYATPYDSLYVLITFLNQASSIDIDILCRNQLEADYVKNLNPKLGTVISPRKSDLDIDKYAAIYMKYISSAKDYKGLGGKTIYISLAEYNYNQKTHQVNPIVLILFGDVNIFKQMDLYTLVKYKPRKEDIKDDLLEHSTGGESKGDSEGNTWYSSEFLD